MEFESANRSIIALKGHPFTRKSQFAAHIAASLECQLLSLHDFLDVLSPRNFQACPCKPAAASPQDIAFQIICQITKSHLSTGLFKHVVVDSRLSSRSHLDQLIQLAASLEQTRLVIIECKADNIYEWQTKFEDYLQLNHPRDKWYKPKNWEDVENEIRVGYDERSDGYEVSKLVLDPILDYQDSTGIPPFIDAVQHMITRSEDDGPDLVVYQRWRQSRYLESKESDRRRPYFRGMYGSKKIRFCSSGGGHYLEELGVVGYNTKCMSCKKQVTGAAYTCKHCSFALHKECAELLDDNNKPPVAPSHEDLSHKIEGWTELFLGLSPCISCEEGYNPNSYPCDDCFFINHLEEEGVLPTVIRHGCDEHFLCVMFAYLNPNEEHFQCKACGDPVEVVWYSCKVCGVAYHYSCLTEIPVRVEHEHGGHHHHMLLQYSSQEDEDYLCYVCFENEAPERRDPSRWFYSCQECEYVAHLRCVGDGCRMFSMNKCLNQEEEIAVATASQKSESWGSDKEEEDDDGQLRPCSAGSGHDISNYMEEGLEYEAKCGVCENQVTGAAYTCKLCSFALHKECAELVDDHNKPLVGLSAYSMDSVLSVGYQGFILDSCRCSSCAEKAPVDSDSSPCGDCLFTTHLKNKMLPTVIRHDCHQHFLSIVINDLNPESKCGCNACGNPVCEIWYSCKMCGVDYDYECLTKVAVRVEHEHHRQHHRMLIQYSSNEEAEDSLCDVCLERGQPGTRDPSIWFYSCQDCTFEAHLKCVPHNGLTQDEDASSVDTNYGD